METQSPVPDEFISTEQDDTSPLNKLVSDAAAQVSFGEGYSVQTVDTPGLYLALKGKGLGPDSRAKLDDSETNDSALKGLSFNQEKVTSQIFSIMEHGEPIGVMTFNIAPKSYIEKEKYLKRESDGIRIVDFRTLTNGEGADFYIIPAWTELAEGFKGSFTIAKSGMKLFDSILGVLVNEAPENTWVESVAQGEIAELRSGEDPRDRFERVKKIRELTDQEFGTLIPLSEFPFSIESFGKNGVGSSATVSNSRRIGLVQAENIASDGSLGPVFIKKVAKE